MPVRKIPKNYRNITGYVASSKNEDSTGFESGLEKDFFMILDFDHNVQRYEEQPVRIEYLDRAGKSRTYTPDGLVVFRKDIVPAKDMCPWLCEIKYRNDLLNDWKKYKPKFKAARKYAKSRGWRFRILTEKEIRTPYLKNVKFLRPYRRVPACSEFRELLLQAMFELREADPQSLLLAVFQDKWRRAELLPVLWRMVYEKRIGTDLTLPLTMHSRIWTTEI